MLEISYCETETILLVARQLHGMKWGLHVLEGIEKKLDLECNINIRWQEGCLTWPVLDVLSFQHMERYCSAGVLPQLIQGNSKGRWSRRGKTYLFRSVKERLGKK